MTFFFNHIRYVLGDFMRYRRSDVILAIRIIYIVFCVLRTRPFDGRLGGGYRQSGGRVRDRCGYQKRAVVGFAPTIFARTAANLHSRTETRSNRLSFLVSAGYRLWSSPVYPASVPFYSCLP